MSGQDDARTAVHTGQFLYSNRIIDIVTARAAVFFRIGDAEPAVLSHFLDDFTRKFISLVHGKGEGFYFCFCKPSDCRAKFFLFLRSGK